MNCTFLSRNGRCYDSYFILRALEVQGQYPMKMQDGTHLTMLTPPGVQARFVDTLSFMPCSLAELPFDLGIGGIVKKGFFPCTFNVPEHGNYVGPVPDKVYFGVNRMSAKKRLEFDTWCSTAVTEFGDRYIPMDQCEATALTTCWFCGSVAILPKRNSWPCFPESTFLIIPQIHLLSCWAFKCIICNLKPSA